MARYSGPKQKIARRYREPLFGFSKALDRKNYGPGQHGKGRKGKPSNFAIQLSEKQKAKYLYGVLERQFRKIFQQAARLKGSTGDNLMQLLECRLDNTVYRMGFSPSRRGARQLVSHKHVTVNKQVVNIPSYQLKPGDVVEVRERSKSLESVNDSLSGKPNRYPWITIDKANLSGTFLNYPERTDIPENIQERLIVELYSR